MNFQFLTAVWSKWAKSLICFCKKMCETSVGSTFKNHQFFPYWLRQGQRLNLVQNSLRLVESVLLASVGFFKSDPWYIKKVQKTASMIILFLIFFPLFGVAITSCPPCSAVLKCKLQCSQNEAKINSWRTQNQTIFQRHKQELGK